MEQIGQSDPRAVALVEAALILEAGMTKRLDRLVVVTCHPEQRIERWAHRLKVDVGTARREVTRRMAAQLEEDIAHNGLGGRAVADQSEHEAVNSELVAAKQHANCPAIALCSPRHERFVRLVVVQIGGFYQIFRIVHNLNSIVCET